MSYYNPSFGGMTRGGRGGGGYSPRGGFRGSNRGNRGYGGRSEDRFSMSFESGGRYSRNNDYHKPYRMDGYSRERGHSPERKRLRVEGPRYDSYNTGRYSDYHPSERRYSEERGRHPSSSPYAPSRREEFRKPSTRGSYRGRLSSRGPRGGRRDRGGPPRRRFADSYGIRKRGRGARMSDLIRKAKLARLRSIRRSNNPDSSENASSDEEGKEKKEKPENAEEAEGENGEVKEGQEKEGEEKMETDEKEGEEKPKEKKEKKEKEEKSEKKSFVKLVCPQCNVKVPTFRRYESHLLGKIHMFAMRKVALKQKSILAQMRQAQRRDQNELEKSTDDLGIHTNFCHVCKLNYKQHKSVHQKTEAHKNMRKFLMPQCKTCKITLRSPMMYENHLCSIDHLKRKQLESSAGSGEEDNLENFTTIDSIGDAEENGSDEEKDKEKRVSIGVEKIVKIEAHYCDLCRMFLPRCSEEDAPDVLHSHCKKRFHVQRFIRHNEIEESKRRAEKQLRKEKAAKEKKKDEKKEGDADESGEIKQVNEDNEEVQEEDANKTNDDDKMWDAVDKDLGDLLEGDAAKSDDDDDDSRVNGERYDRFKLSEDKKGKVEEKPAEEKAAEIKVEEK